MYNFDKTQSIAVPKGENRAAAELWLQNNGLEVPEISARCLHLYNW